MPCISEWASGEERDEQVYYSLSDREKGSIGHMIWREWIDHRRRRKHLEKWWQRGRAGERERQSYLAGDVNAEDGERLALFRFFFNEIGTWTCNCKLLTGLSCSILISGSWRASASLELKVTSGDSVVPFWGEISRVSLEHILNILPNPMLITAAVWWWCIDRWKSVSDCQMWTVTRRCDLACHLRLECGSEVAVLLWVREEQRSKAGRVEEAASTRSGGRDRKATGARERERERASCGRRRTEKKRITQREKMKASYGWSSLWVSSFSPVLS